MSRPPTQSPPPLPPAAGEADGGRWNVSAWAIRQPVAVTLLFLVLAAVGLWSYGQLGHTNRPSVELPLVTVLVAQPGASPNELEREVTRKIEDAVANCSNVEHIKSTAIAGLSSTLVEFRAGVSGDRALNEVRAEVTRIRAELPGAIREPVITRASFDSESIMVCSVSSPGRSTAELSRMIDQRIKRALLEVPGVGHVNRLGGVDREIRVSLDPERVEALGLTLDGVNDQIRAQNVDLAGGRGDVAGAEQVIRALGSTQSLASLRALPIAVPGGGTTRLDSVAEVADTVKDRDQVARLNDRSVVAFTLSRAEGFPVWEVYVAARDRIAELGQALPADVRIEIVSGNGDFVHESFQASLDALYLGGVLAIVVIFAFLRNWRATVISLLAMPLSIVPTFFCMRWLGYQLDFMTMLGLTMVVGILVDDAIVDLENIFRHMAMGKSPLRAALEATSEIGLAIVATTLAIVAVFIPIAFMGGTIGPFFKAFACTVVCSVMFSLLVARTLTPLLAASWLPADQRLEDPERWYHRAYQDMMVRALRVRPLVLGLAVLVSVGSLGFVPLLPKGFLSLGDIGATMVDIALPVGSSLADTERVMRQASAIVQAQPCVRYCLAVAGAPGPSDTSRPPIGGERHRATLYIRLVPKSERGVSQSQFQEAIRPLLDRIPGARVAVVDYGTISEGKQLGLILHGREAAEVERTADRVLHALRGLEVLRDVTSTKPRARAEVQIVPDANRALEQGVSVAEIGKVARLATQGDADVNLGKFDVGADEHAIDIRVQLPERFRGELSAIADLPLRGSAGVVPLRAVADVRLGSGLTQINRFDRERQVTLEATPVGGDLMGAYLRVIMLPAMHLPDGVKLATSGETKVMGELFGSFGVAMAIGVLLIYAVLVLLFGSFILPLVIMMALPLAFGGAFAGLLLTGKELGMMAQIGFLVLMGLVTKNSILLVEYAMMSQRDGMARDKALLHAGRERLRPIMMTTIAMIAGMLPIAFSLGEGTDRLSPMAVAVIGGLVTSTLLTLVVIPVVFTYVDDMRLWLLRLRGGAAGRGGDAPPPLERTVPVMMAEGLREPVRGE